MELELLINKKKDEKVIFYLRRHWLVFFGDILMVGVLAVVPYGAYFLIDKMWNTLLIGALSRPTLILLTSAYYLVIWLFFITTFVDYYLDAWIITDDRILNVEQHGLFSRTISELDLAKIQDVTSEVKGVIPSIFNYGQVFIQTAGETERFIFEQIPKPHDVRKTILQIVEDDRRKQGELLARPNV